MKSEKTTGQRIKDILEEKGIQAKTLAEYLGVTQAAMSNYLNDKRNIDTDTLIKISNFLNISTDELLGIRENRSFYFDSTVYFSKEEVKKAEQVSYLFSQLSNAQKEIIINLAKDLVNNNRQSRSNEKK